MKAFKLLLIIISIISIESCKCTGGPQLMPNVSGKAGEVVVVIGKGDWEAEAGAALRATLAIDEPFLPQREPMFALVNVPESAFSKIFQTHRNIIVINVLPEQEEPKIIFQENVWAAPQIVVTISASKGSEVAKIVLEQQDRLSGAILMAERNRNIQNAKRYEEREVRAVVGDEFGGSPYFQKDTV